MTLKRLEAGVQRLQTETKRLNEQAAENSFAKDYLEIWKLMSMYAYLYYVGRLVFRRFLLIGMMVLYCESV